MWKINSLMLPLPDQLPLKLLGSMKAIELSTWISRKTMTWTRSRWILFFTRSTKVFQFKLQSGFHLCDTLLSLFTGFTVMLYFELSPNVCSLWRLDKGVLSIGLLYPSQLVCYRVWMYTCLLILRLGQRADDGCQRKVALLCCLGLSGEFVGCAADEARCGVPYRGQINEEMLWGRLVSLFS